MGTNMPQDRGEALDWVEAHIEPWTTHATAIDLSPEQVAAITLLAQTARQKATAAGTARDAAKAATQEWHDSADNMKAFTSTLIADIKAFARTEANDQIYALAQISKRAKPGEAQPPAVPSSVKSTVTNDGDVELRWKGKGPTGTRYHVLRKLPTQNNFAFLGDTSEKLFIDRAVPSGTSPIVYQIVAVHTENRVPGEPIYVRFGTANGQAGQAGQAGQGGQGAA